jgi:hypothetical protein
LARSACFSALLPRSANTPMGINAAMQELLFSARRQYQSYSSENAASSTPDWLPSWHGLWSRVMAEGCPDSFRVLQGVVGASGASPHIERFRGSTWAQLDPHRTHTGIAPLRGIVMALSWEFGHDILGDIMLPWVLDRGGSSPPHVVKPGDHSDSSHSSLGDLEQSQLAVAPPDVLWRECFRFALMTMGFNMEGTDEFVEICHLLDHCHSTVVGRGPPIFSKRCSTRAAYNAPCTRTCPILPGSSRTPSISRQSLAFAVSCTHSFSISACCSASRIGSYIYTSARSVGSPSCCLRS